MATDTLAESETAFESATLPAVPALTPLESAVEQSRETDRALESAVDAAALPTEAALVAVELAVEREPDAAAAAETALESALLALFERMDMRELHARQGALGGIGALR